MAFGSGGFGLVRLPRRLRLLAMTLRGGLLGSSTVGALVARDPRSPLAGMTIGGGFLQFAYPICYSASLF